MPLIFRLIPACVLMLGGCSTTARNMDTVPLYDTRAAQEFLLLNIQERSDASPADEWRSCKRTLQLGYGDCEDFASCALELVTQWHGCSSAILIVQGSRMLHAVTSLSCENGLAGYFDNGTWVAGDAQQDYPYISQAIRWPGTSRAAQLTRRNFSAL